MELQPASRPHEWTFRSVMAATLVVVLVALSFWLLYRFYRVVVVVFIALVLGTVIRPVVMWLFRRGLPRVVGVILVYVVLLALLTSFVLLLFPLIVEQGSALAAAAPGYYQSLRQWIVSYPSQLIVQLGGLLPVSLPGPATGPQTGKEVLDSAAQAMGFVASAAKGIFIAAAILLLALRWALDGPRTIRSFLLMVPQARRENIGELISTMETKVSSYVAGQGLLCLVIGILALVAYLLIGLPNALVLAILAGALEAVPMIGPLLGAIPAAAIALSIAPSKLIWVIVATLVIQQLENTLLVPRVMRKAVGVNPFVSLLALFAFSSLLGIPGALMAIPLAAIFQLLLDRFVFEPVATESETANGHDYASRLRYEAQDLAQSLRKQTRIEKGGPAQNIKQVDRVMDEIEAIATDLDALLAKVRTGRAP